MPDSPDNKRPVHRKDADGKIQAGPTWESLIDRQIREAMEEGKFDDLPLHGQPLQIDDNPYAGDWSLAFHMLKNAGVAPPWIEADKHVRDLLAQRDAILSRATTGAAPSELATRRDRAKLETLVGDINVAIARLNAEAPLDSQRRVPLVLAQELARYETTCRR